MHSTSLGGKPRVRAVEIYLRRGDFGLTQALAYRRRCTRKVTRGLSLWGKREAQELLLWMRVWGYCEEGRKLDFLERNSNCVKGITNCVADCHEAVRDMEGRGEVWANRRNCFHLSRRKKISWVGVVIASEISRRRALREYRKVKY